MTADEKGPTGSAHHPVSAKREYRVPTVSMQDLDGGLSAEGIQEGTKDPDRHYAWVRDDESQLSVRRRQRQGYNLEDYREGGPVPEAGKQPDSGDNIIRAGDRVLMSRPKVLHDRYVDARFQRSESRLNSTTDQLKEEAAKKNVRVIQDRSIPNEL